MLDWLKKLGASSPYENKAGLDGKSLKLLAEDFAPLDELAPDLGARLARFVVDGNGEDVLAELAAHKQAAEKLLRERAKQLLAGNRTPPRNDFFQSARCGSPEFYRRLGLAYEAGTRQSRIHSQASGVFGDPKLNWLETLLVEGTQLALNCCRPSPVFTAELLEALIEMEGHPPELLVRTAFQPQPKSYGCPKLEPIFLRLDGLGRSAVLHRDALVSVLSHADFNQRVYALSMMKKCRVPPDEFAEKLVELAVGPSKQVREFAESLLDGIRPAAKDLLVHKASEGANEERSAAARLLWRWAGENARAFMEYRLTLEKNNKVSQTIRDLLGASLLNAAIPAEDTELPQLPPLAPIPARLPLGAETERAWRECFDKVNAGIAQLNAARPAKYRNLDIPLVSADAIRKAFADLQGGRVEPVLSCLLYEGWHKEISEPLKPFWQRSELHLAHLVRFFIQVGAVPLEPGPNSRFVSNGFWLATFIGAFHRTHPEAGLRELGAAYTAAGLDARRIGSLLLGSFGSGAVFGMPSGQIWPYWAEHLDKLEQAFAPCTGDYVERERQKQRRASAFETLACFPKPPAPLLPILWDLALGPKGERPQAQRCLEGASNKLQRLTVALTSGSADARLAAAEWLGRLGEKSALEALLTAFQREKNEAAKGAMMTAMEQLGAPMDQFLDRDGLVKQAAKGVAKGPPEDLKWFPFDQLPAVHWQDTEKSVEPVILQWWLIQGFKLKNPEPGALLRRYCASMAPSEREALGQFILEAWLAEDVALIPRAEAEQRAMSAAQNMLQSAQYLVQIAQQNPQRQINAPPVLTVEEYYAQVLPNFLKQAKGSAIASKGILSVAGACAGAAAAPAVNRYLKDWFGMRAAQCRALLQMLAWVEHRTATQLLLAVGSRFRTKGIQEEANIQARALAERKGWSVAELADRTIPTAGLDDDGALALDFGPRQFTAKLSGDLEFVLVDAGGKTLKSLPDPRKDDDEAKAAEAKKTFSAAKKELKSVVTMQRDRLYEAMCVQRTWPFEDWNLYLNRHPIARHHCQRLVWAAVRGGKDALLFRPLPDGALTDTADDPVALQPGDLVRVAHECQITPEQSLAWRQHLKDYNIEPLFEQFGRAGYGLAEERKQEDELADFRGHILEAFKLRGRAAKLGYTRGQAQDGGWFCDYRKRFPTLGMEAVIEFTGNGLPEENRTVALTLLHFDRVAGEGEPALGGAKMALGEVPPVLLGECWNDIRQIAGEGPGFDADWEKKTRM
jgi:hypothetical protein